MVIWFLHIICIYLFMSLVKADYAQPAAPQLVQPSLEPSSKPALVRQNSSCTPKFINNKRIIYPNSDPNACINEAKHEAKQKKFEEVEAARLALLKHMAEPKPPKKETCIKAVDPKTVDCINKNVIKRVKNNPHYFLVGKSNEVIIYKKDKPIMMAVLVQSHFTKKPKKITEQAEAIKNSKELVVYNRLGEVLSSKQRKPKKPLDECICPGQVPPQTTETLANTCVKPQCKNYDLFSVMFSNTTINTENPNSPAPGNGKPAPKK